MSSLYGLRPGDKVPSSFEFRDQPYSSFRKYDMNFLNLPVYRADTKEEFLLDAGNLVFTLATGGWKAGIKFAADQLERDQ